VADATTASRVVELIREVQLDSAEHAERLGIPSKAAPRYLAGLEMLIQRLCEPANRRILLLDGPVVLGRARWDALFGTPMRELIYSVFWAGMQQGDVRSELVEPLAYMLYGALQEMALAIGQAKDPEVARSEFGAAAVWVLERLLQRRDGE
jgi:hypothetical protein